MHDVVNDNREHKLITDNFQITSNNEFRKDNLNFMKQTKDQFFFTAKLILLIIVFSANIRAATYTVTNVTDSGGGSLRDAITTANSTTESDTILFNITESCHVCTIILNTDLTINSTATSGSLTITNPTGADRLLISGNNRTRIFYVRDGAGFVLSGVTITNGNAAGTLNTQYNGYGGGIMLAFLNSGGVFTLTNSIIRNNTAQYGGGLYRSGTSSNLGSTTITNSTISNNSAQEGGGINNAFRMTVTNSTVSNNTAGVGGGIYNDFGTLTMTNSTISGNSASSGGGVNNRNGSITLRDLTISRNTASAQGGGIYSTGSFGFSSIGNSIVAANTAVNGQPDIYKTSNFASNGYNLVGNSSTSGIINWFPNDILDQQSRLAPLGNYGGGTQTHALLSGSPAINAGNRSTLLDQRGLAQNGASDIGAFELQVNENYLFRNSFDFDGDGKADISVFRPSDRNWYLNRSTQVFAAVQWGLATDKLVPADYDGDGKTDVAVWREGSFANFYVLNSSDNTVRIEQFGQIGDVLTVGDWDGDGKADPAVYRDSAVGSQSYFYYRGSNNNPNRNVSYLSWGSPGDKPQFGDFDNDGKRDLAVFRPSNNTWYIRQSSDSQIRYENWGLATDIFVPADYDGDGKTDLAVFRNGVWYIRNSSNNQSQNINFGIGSDIPVPADYDGDGRADVSVFRNGTWYLNQSSSGVAIRQFGIANDKPVPAAYLP